ncbi:MAG: hypothetical protein QM785_08085 [Pyrinomonadaceae bacterium]
MKRLVWFAMVIISLVFTSGVAAQSLEDNEDYRTFRKWVVANQQGQPLPIVYEWCVEAYNKMIAGGVSPSTRVVEDKNWGDFWKGTVQEINEKYCGGAKTKLTADLEAKHAPYKAALKADKLRLMIDTKTGTVYSYALAGGKYTDDAKALAAAKVWFLDIGPPSNEAQNCLTGGRRNSVRRYTFDAEHKLLGTTEKQYCGDPPASAYR